MATIELRREVIDDDGHEITTDGPHVYFPCVWTRRIRWALRHHPDDGIGIRTHGAADTIEDAVRDAHRMQALRKEAT